MNYDKETKSLTFYMNYDKETKSLTFCMNYDKETKSLTVWRGSEVSQEMWEFQTGGTLV